MRGFVVTGALGLAFGLWGNIVEVGGQTIPKSLQEGGPEEIVKQRENAWTVGLAGGAFDGTYLRLADEIGKVLDDGDRMRVLPIITHGAAGNLEDLLYLRGVDVAFTQSDVFEYFRTERKTPHLEDRIRYIVRLPVAEFHLTVRPEIQTLEDLRGKKVVFGPPGSSSSLTGPIVFQRLKLPVEPVYIDFLTGYKMLLAGEVHGFLGTVSKPVDFWLQKSREMRETGLHLLPVPYSKAFADIYAIGELTNADYPNLIPPGERIDTVAVPSVLAVYNWPKNSDRYRRVERFVQYLFNRWGKLTQPPFHPRWRDVNLAATVPGWTRFSVAEEMLQRPVQQDVADDQAMARDFQTYVTREVRTAPRNEAERNAIFRQFMLWREQQRRQ
jgi:TRAP-type uncharacterized transport system substrate-binding protein